MVTSLSHFCAFTYVFAYRKNREGNMLDTNWLRIAKELVKFVALWVLYSMRYCLSKTAKFLVGKSG